MARKGIILAGGSGTRLYPVTQVVSKQLLPVYDKPMIYYPLSHADAGGHPRHPDHLDAAGHAALRSAARRRQPVGHEHPVRGAAVAGRAGAGVHHRPRVRRRTSRRRWCSATTSSTATISRSSSSAPMRAADGATVFAYHVHDPERYGVVEFDAKGRALSHRGKAARSRSRNYAVTGLYFYDNQVLRHRRRHQAVARAASSRSPTSTRRYLERRRARRRDDGARHAWLDTGTHESLLEAATFIATLEKRQGLVIACPEEIAYRQALDRRRAIARARQAAGEERLRPISARSSEGPSRMAMQVTATALPDVMIIEPKVFGDARGFFFESFNAREFAEQVEARRRVRAGQSFALGAGRAARAALSDRACAGQARARGRGRSVRRRGRPAPQLAELRQVGRRRCCRRRTSGSCGFRRASRTASSCCRESAEFLYKTTDYWYPEHERSIVWNDPALGIEWPIDGEPLLAAKDAAGKRLADADVLRLRHAHDDA